MGLENLKSVFSNIKIMNQSDVTQAENLQTLAGDSGDSIITEPQVVDYMSNEKSIGFTANQSSQSPTSLFTGISDESINMTFTNNSLYGDITSINKIPLLDAEDFTPTTLNDEIINPFTTKFLADAKDFTPTTPNDVIITPFTTSPLTDAEDFTPTTPNDVIITPFTTPSVLGTGELVFETLYNGDHTVTDAKYLERASKDLFDITGGNSQLSTVDPNRVYTGSTVHGIFKKTVTDVSSTLKSMGIKTGLGDALNLGTGTEPYVVTEIGSDETTWTDQFLPLARLQKDVQRVGKFMSSQKGEEFTLQQNLMGTFQQYKGIYDPSSTILNIASPKEGLGTPLLRFSRDKGIGGIALDLWTPTTYTEYLDARAGTGGFDMASIGSNIGSAFKKVFKQKQTTYAEKDLKHKPLAFKALDLVERGAGFVGDDIGLGSQAKDIAGIDITSGIDSRTNVQTSMGTNAPLGDLGKGDVMTLWGWEVPEIIEKKGLAKFGQGLVNFGSNAIESTLGTQIFQNEFDIESSKEGMPFYFKDLRDGSFIIFRAYLGGLSETISPSWSPTNYIGRSEPVYTYTNSEREINFNLKLFAQTKDELNMIYKKMNKLTSMCYPEYKSFEAPIFGETDKKSILHISR